MSSWRSEHLGLMVVTCALAVAAAWYVSGRPAPVVAAPVAQVDRVSLVRQWFDPRNRGDADAAMAMLADNAVLAHGPCPLTSPCVGEANRAYIATGTQHTVLTLQELGSGVSGRIEIRNQNTQVAGVNRVLRNVLFQIPQDKIAAYVAIPDLADPETARVDGR